MKILVCYPMKSLAKTYLPRSVDALVAESADEYFRLVHLYRPDTAIIFSEMFSSPVWEWLPSVQAALPSDTPLIIVPLYRDVAMIRQVVEELSLQGVYLLSSQLSQTEIREKICLILGFVQESAEVDSQSGGGQVYAMMSYGASGITTFCINFPILLARQNPEARIMVLDMNDAKPDLTRFFKLHQHQLALFRPDFLDVEKACKRDWVRVCKQSDIVSNLYYAHAANKWKSAELSNMMDAFRSQFDYIYVDWGYCFPETEAMHRLMHIADRNLLFVRADPFSIENAREWIGGWKKRGIPCEVLLSHLDKGHPYRIGEEVSLYGVLPRISESRMMQSLHSSSVLIEELFPPKSYISSLEEILKTEYSLKSVVLSR
jgi:cellulose biosynthesis protein BcsQ